MQLGVKRVANALNESLQDTQPLFLAVLNGSFMFAADLLREITVACDISFIKVASYQGMQSSGEVKHLLGLNESVSGRTVVIVEDIVDSGRTVEALKKSLLSAGAVKVIVVAALFKPAALQVGAAPDHCCFEIDNVFVVGYGLDYNGQGRNLKEVHILA